MMVLLLTLGMILIWYCFKKKKEPKSETPTEATHTGSLIEEDLSITPEKQKF